MATTFPVTDTRPVVISVTVDVQRQHTWMNSGEAKVQITMPLGIKLGLPELAELVKLATADMLAKEAEAAREAEQARLEFEEGERVARAVIG